MEQSIALLEQDKASLRAQLTELSQEKIVLERTLQIDREANRTAQERLKVAQDEHLALEKEVSFLRRLIREGGGGILRIQDFAMAPSDEPDAFDYSFTVSQLIQDFGESAGKVQINVAGKREGQEVSLPLKELAGSKPASHKMRFEHFQNFDGVIRLPGNLEPETLIVEIKPTTKRLIPVTETFPWKQEN